MSGEEKGDMLSKAKNLFMKEKKLLLKNLPSSTKEKDIRAFMGFNGEFPVEEVVIVKHLNQAIVTLKDPSQGEDVISKLNNTSFEDETVYVGVYHSDRILCMAHLPRDFTEEQFHDLITQHGDVEMGFLMRSQHTDESKGYGFVEYNEPIERVGQIKYVMDGCKLDDAVIHCDAIVDSNNSALTFEDLHSTCLLIDNLPAEYTDSIALRELFSQLVKPVYCQIIVKENVSLGFGIVEYDNSDDAEKALTKFNGHEVNGVPINVTYCIPGKSAVHMFNRIMFKYGEKVHVNKASLLPDPVYPNPVFLKHVFFKTHHAKHPRLLVQFTDDLLHLQEVYVKQLENKTNAKPGLLGPAPTIPMSPLMDVNLQLGLLSLIVLDMRQKGTYPAPIPDPLGKLKIPTEEEFQHKPEPVSLLGDPMTAQANIVLRNILTTSDDTLAPPKTDDSEYKLLGKPMSALNLVHVCSLGRLMAMMTEKGQNMGILGTGPPQQQNHPGSQSSSAPPPLIEGLMKAGKVAQSILNSINQHSNNNNNFPNNNANFPNKNFNFGGNNASTFNGNFGNNSMGPNNRFGNNAGNFGNNSFGNNSNRSNNFGNNNFGNNSNSMGNNGSNFGNNSNNQNSILGEPPANVKLPNTNFMNNVKALQKLSENQGGKGRSTGFGNLGNQSKGDGLLGNYQGQGQSKLPSSLPQPLLGKPQSLLSLNLNNKGEGLIPIPDNNDISMPQYPNLSGWDDYGDSEYQNDDNNGFGNYGNSNQGRSGHGNFPNSSMSANFNNVGADGGAKNNMPVFGGGNMDYDNTGAGNFNGTNRRQLPNKPRSLLGQDMMNSRQNMGAGHAMGGSEQLDGDTTSYSSMAEKAALYAAGAAAAYKHQYDEYMAQQQQQQGYTNSYNSNYNSYNAAAADSSSSQYNSSQNYASYGNNSYNAGNNYSKQQLTPGNNSYNAGNNYSKPQLTPGNNSYNAGNNYSKPQLTPGNNRNNSSNNMSSYNRQNTDNYAGYSTGSLQGTGSSLMGEPPLSIGSWRSGATNMGTPQGQKRPFSHILQSPEPSPEGDYIGQHSQGIGGHYADSYVSKRQKLAARFT